MTGAWPAAAQVITSADLQIQGATFRIVNATAAVQLGSPAIIQTSIGGLQNEQAPPFASGIVATGELIGPGIVTPVPFTIAPGHAFTITGLSQEGTYYLRNVRMMNGAQLLQAASPSLATITVTNALNATVTVRQLSADELRKRGITLDATNYDVYEYTFSFLINGQTVQIPYPVIVNRITHETTPLPAESPYQLPLDQAKAPPRWNPPATIPVDFPEPADFSPPPQTPDNPDAAPARRPQIHAAIVIPNSLAVLHEFFAVALVVTNGAPLGSGVELNSITAAIDTPNQLRVAKSDPAVSFGQPVSIAGPNNSIILVAQAQGKAEWTLEGLKPGTYTVNLDIKATFHSPGQPDVPLEATPRASVVVHDARFNITFSHPDTIRKGLPYSTYTFITNVSDSAKDITLSDGQVPPCSGPGTKANVCRLDTAPSSFPLHLEAGETKSVEYRLQSAITGHVFATAVSIDGDNSAINSAAFTLDMGVSPTGVPLSPVTLLMPHYAASPFFSEQFIDDQLGFLGIAYSLATAPLNKTTAKFPRLVTSDVFTRAVDIARAGERIFIGEDRRDSLANLSLDLLGNAAPLAEWDQFRRQEIADPSGDATRAATKAMATELASAFGADGTFNGMADRFASATSDRGPYLLALARGAKSGSAPSFAIRVDSGSQVLDGITSNWKRDIPYGDLSALDASAEGATLAMIGRAAGAYDLTITPAVSGTSTLDLIIPAADTTKLIRVTASFSGVVHVHVANGVATSTDAVTFTTTPVAIAPMRMVAARQDLYLDTDGHVVSVLFNRRLQNAAADLSPSFGTDVTLDASKYLVSFSGKRIVAGAALQGDGRIVRVNYDNALSNDAQYTIRAPSLVDATSAQSVVPKVEDRNSALLLGAVLKGDNTPVAGASLKLSTGSGIQYATSDSAGRFLFEYVPRDVDSNLSGGYDLVATGTAAGQESKVTGSVRLLHTVHQVNVVFLGRGSAKGVVRYEDGTAVASASVVIGSTLFSQFRSGTTSTLGAYNITDLPVGPLTFSAQDAAGNIAYAANELHGAGELVLQDVTITRKPFPGTGTVKGRITRSDTHDPVAGTHVGVYSQGYGLKDGITDSDGRFTFSKVPSGFVRVLAENYAVAPLSIAVDFDLKPDETHDVGDLVLGIVAAGSLVSIGGPVTIEDPYVAGNFSAVPAAQVQIAGMPVVTADGNGNYRYDAVPDSFAGKAIRAFDPKSGRVASATLPTNLSPEGVNNFPIRITNAAGSGTGTVRVHLLDATGHPVTGYHVFEPGFPRVESSVGGEGIYEFANIRVGGGVDVVAAPAGVTDPNYGYQFVQGHAGISFPGQIAALTLRLPGQGSVHGVIKQKTQAGVLVQLAGQLRMYHRYWSDAEQNPKQLARVVSTDGSSDAIFAQVPANESVLLETLESVGYASTTLTIGFDGQRVDKTLELSTLASVTGRVFMPDGYTPVAGADVELTDSAQNNHLPTALDGSFTFQNVAPSSGYTVIANFTQNGIYRTARATGTTPQKGGPADAISLILLKQGAVDGTVVNANNQPIPFAKIWMKEVGYPDRDFGKSTDPQFTDANGHFHFGNVFAVPFRIAAEDPSNPDLRGSFNGAITDEAQTVQATVIVGGAGTGSVTVNVVDPNNSNQPVANAEVSLYRGSLFDFGTTDLNGNVTFQQVPAGSNYTAGAYSKALAKSGASSSFTIVKDTTAQVRVTLLFSGEILGVLDDPQNSNAPVPAADVNLYGADYQTRATTDAQGAFDFKGVREGNVQLTARDPNSIRIAKSGGAVTSADPRLTVPLHLELTSTVTVKVFLPNDSGGNSGVLAPNVNIDVAQNAPGGKYARSSQTNGAQFAGLVRKIGFQVDVQELGGLSRSYTAGDVFGDTVAAKEIDIVLAATGSVIVHVQQGSPAVDAPNVQVTASSGGASSSGFTDSSGRVTLTRLPLGPNVSIQAKTLGSQPLTGSTSVALTSQSQAANATILLGSYGSVTGKVIAEGGGASAGTRVFVSYNGIQLETRTDFTGTYLFQGIVTGLSGTTVALTYIGPDDNTVGAAQSVFVPNGGGVVSAPDVTLDSTPPRLTAIFPAENATKVAPDTQLKFTFSRAVRDDQLHSGFFKLFDVGAGTQLTLTLASKQILGDKSEIVTFSAPAPPAGQHFPLKSNTLYRTEISSELQDLANHKLGSNLGASFTTSDYSNPQVVKVEPKSPLPKNNFRIAVTFSKPLAPAPWQSGGSGVMQLVPISGMGGSVTGSPLPGQVQLDPNTGAALYFAPNVFLTEASYYRLTVSGVLDLEGRGLVDANGNAIASYTQDFFSFDLTAPGITLGNPTVKNIAIGDNDPLFHNTLYRFPAVLTNASDIDTVDFYSVDGAGALTPIGRSTPTSVDIALPTGTTTFTLKAIATDLSGNKANATRTWSVTPQPALAVSSATITPATIYANNTLTDTVVITGGGLDEKVTVSATIEGSSTVIASNFVNITRSTFSADWPSAAVQLTIPATVAGGAHVVLTEAVSDTRGGAASHTSNVTIATDTAAPLMQALTIEVTSGTSNSSFHNNDQFRVHAFAKDGETGVKQVVFTVDGVTYTVTGGTLRSSGYTEFVSPSFVVKARNNDLTMAVNAVATDYAALSTTATTGVTYLGQHDPNAPTAAWIAPLHDAAWPASTTLHVRLRVFATSSLQLGGTFDVPGLSGPQTGSRSGNEIVLDLPSFTTPAAGTPFTIVAHVNDGDGGHTVDLPISIDLVDVNQTLHAGDVIAVDAQHPLSGDSVLVDGGRLVPHVPVTLKNLIVLNGGKVDTVPSTTLLDQKLDLTVSGHLYVDDASSIDVSKLGYLGGLQQNADNTGSNASANGTTAGRSTANGAASGASGSYAGLGGADAGATNAAYGSIVNPTDLGSGGAATGTTRGAQGGGSASIAGAAKVVIAGNVLADGESGAGLGGAGSGGSIHIAGSQIVVGALATVSANGGDDDGSANTSRGGGGGRVSIEATALLDVDANNGARVVAHGGRNLAGEGAAVLEGGAGTIFLRAPGATNGDLVVSAYDPRNPATTHSTLPAVLAGALNFDHLTVASRGLARADAALTIGGVTDDRTKASVDATSVLLLSTDQPTITVSTAPAAGSSVIGGTSISATYSVTSLAGVSSVTTTLAPVVAASSDSYAFLPSKTFTKVVNVPSSASSGTATLTLHVADRAGRGADTAPLTFNIVANTPPAITAFNVNAPSPLYIGATIGTTITATDDLALSKVSLTSKLGAQTAVTQTFTPPANTTSTTQNFNVAIPRDATLDGAAVTLTANAQDAGGDPGTSSVRTLTIGHDGIAPAVTITQPVAGHDPYLEGSGNLIHVVAIATDNESGIKTIIASVEGGQSVAMTATANPNEFAADLAIPAVPGSVNVTRTVTVTVTDYVNNVTAPTRSITITPVLDPSAPVITFLCGTQGAMFPVGSTVTLSVTATPGTVGNPVDSVTFSDGTSTTFNVTKNGNVYSTTYTVPNRAEGNNTITISVTGTSGSGSQTETADITAVTLDKTIPAGTTVNLGDLTYDFQNVAVTSGTVTLIGHHEFKRLLVLNGATLTQKTADTTSAYGLDIKNTLGMYVGCGSFVSVTSSGYGTNKSYPGAATPTGNGGGTHLGYGGGQSAPTAIYGSVYTPGEAGSGGNRNGNGGGIVHIDAPLLTVDGKLTANGCGTEITGGTGDGCAGGSIWLVTPALNGSGVVEAKGGGGLSGNGGGGAISIEYTTSIGAIVKNVAAFGGADTGGLAGAGTIYVKQPTGAYGTLTVNDNGKTGTTELPSLGSGTAAAGSSGALVVTDRTADIPTYFVNHWVEVTTTSTGAKNVWRILSVDNSTASKKFTLKPNAGETISIQQGDTWRGVYRFDAVSIAANENLISNDPILIGAAGLHTVIGTKLANTYSNYPNGITGDAIDVTGHVQTTLIKAASLTLEPASIVTHASGSSLTLNVTGALTVKSGAAIDVSQRGYTSNNQTFPGAAQPVGNGGGSHLGYGGGQASTNATFGSVYTPQEFGGAGNRNGGGGGAVRITAGSVANDGTILANGCGTALTGGTGDGCAGGSIWIVAPSVGGTGSIEAKGGGGLSGNGGGGAISIAYGAATGTLLANVRAFGGADSGSLAGAGTIYLKPDSGTFGSLTVFNNGRGGTTELPSFGFGSAQSGSGGAVLITDRAVNIPTYFVNHWVEIRDGTTNALKGIWRIQLDPTNLKKVTLVPNSAGDTITVAQGDTWRGIYRFDDVTLNGIVLRSGDRIDGTIVKQNGATVIGNNLAPPAIDKTKITITNGALGPVMVGAANAIVDVDTPVIVSALNQTTATSAGGPLTVAADGSFSMPLRGATGNDIAVFAIDSNAYPLQTPPVFIAKLTAGNVATSPIATSTMTTDTNFNARRLAFDNTTLLVQNYPVTNSTDSNKIAVFDLSGAAPSRLQTITAPTNTRDAAVRNGIAYIAAAGANLHVYDLSTNPATRTASATGTGCNDAKSAAVDGNYVFVGGAGNCGDGSLAVFDVTDPKLPVLLRTQATLAGGSTFAYTQLIPYGGYLIGIQPNGSAHDVVILDRRDINNIVVAWDGTINGIAAFRASLQGTTLYVSGTDGAVAVVDVSNPTLGVVKSIFSAGSAAHGIAAVGTLAFAAADTAGVVAVNVADPVNPAGAGGFAVTKAWDVAIRGKLGMVAAEDALVTFTAPVGPQVNATKVSLSFDGHNVTVTGAPSAILGAAPLTAEVRDDNSGAKNSGVAVNADGSFTTTLTAAAGDVISVVATDHDTLTSAAVRVGVVPFGVSSNFVASVTASGDASNFRAQHMSIDAGKLAVVTASAQSNRLVVYDTASLAAAPQVINVAENARDVALKNGVAYVTAGGSLYTYDLAVGKSSEKQVSADCNQAFSIAVDGSYLFVGGGGGCTDGRIAVFDISSPKSPIRIDSGQPTAPSSAFTQLIPYGNYLVGINPNGAAATGTDVVVIDRQDINNLKVFSSVVIQNMAASRGAIIGKKLYVVSDGKLAVVDLTNLASIPTPVVVSTAGTAKGVAIAGNIVAVGDGTVGVSFFDVSNAAAPRLVATQSVGGAVWDVRFYGGKLYAAAESGVAVINGIVAPPVVDVSRVTITRGSSVTVAGSAGAIAGTTPITVEVRNVTTGATISGLAVAADGSFSTPITAVSGDAIAVVATDANQLTSGVISVGVVPFGASSNFVQITATNGIDAAFRARHMAIDGTTLAVVTYPFGIANNNTSQSNRLVVYDTGNINGTPQVIDVQVTTRDVAVKNGVAYVAAGGLLYAYDLAIGKSSEKTANSDCTQAVSVAVDGTYAFVGGGGSCGDGRITVFDISNAKVPVKLGTGQSTLTAATNVYTQLLPYGNYLVGVNPLGTTGIDVVVIDRHDVNALTAVAQTTIANMGAFRGAIIGTSLYVVGDGKLAIVDLSNPSSLPAAVTIAAAGTAKGVAVAGKIVAVGDGSAGVSFFDVSNPAAPRLVGTQPVGGSAWDVRFAGGKLYVAAEQGIAVINGVVAPPVIDVSRISIARTSNVVVTGTAAAITGATPISATITNETAAATATVSVAADGSFSTPITAVSGDVLSVSATDVNGNSSSVRIGVVPFGSSSSFTQVTGADSSFRARHLAMDGSTLAAVTYPDVTFTSTRVVVYDTTNMSTAPRVIAIENTSDVAVKNGVVYAAAGGSLYAYDLATSTVAPAASADCSVARSVAVDGIYAFVGGAGGCNDGRVAVFDLTNPKVPLRIDNAQSTLTSGQYVQLIPYGNYLIGIASGTGTAVDVAIIDRRDINALKLVSQTAIAGMAAFRGAVIGSTLYVVGDGKLAIVDLTNTESVPAPQTFSTAGTAKGVAVAGNIVAVGDGSAGVTFFDVSNPASPRLIATQSVGGTAWDLRFAGGKLYAAAEQGIAVINGTFVPPAIDVARLAITRAGTTATVSGTAGAITAGVTPITAVVKNETTGVTVSGVAIAANGSFSTAIAAAAGDVISVNATDGGGRSSLAIRVGSVPFGVASQVVISAGTTDAAYRARRLSADGTTLVAATVPVTLPNSNTSQNRKLLVYDTTTMAPAVLTAAENVRDVAVKSGVAYVAAGGTLYTYDLAVGVSSEKTANTGCNGVYSVAADASRVYVGGGGNCNDGHIAFFDLANPKQPAKIVDKSTVTGIVYRQLIPYGANQLIGISPDLAAGRGHDVVVIDKSNVNSLVVVSDTDVAGINLTRARVSGHYLYGVGTNTAATSGAVAIIDLDNIAAAPVVITTPGIPHSLDVDNAAHRLFVADGTGGVTVVDITNPATPRVVGTQTLGGNSWDALLSGTKLYLAGEHVITTIDLN
jgi:hypothetical protein